MSESTRDGSETTSLRVGAAKTDVTPTEAGRETGWGVEADEAYDDLHVRVMTIEDGDDRVAILSGEIKNWRQEWVDEIRAGARERYGLDPGQLILNASHTHEGVRRSDEEYHESLFGTMVETIGAAFDDAREARLSFGRGTFDEPINRRGLTRSGYFVRQINSYGRTDPEITTLRAVDTDGDTVGVLANFACHPTLVKIDKFGGDFPGVMMGMVEEDLDDGAVTLFLQGTAGDVKLPNYSEDKPGSLRFGYGGGLEKVTATARRFADAVLESLESDTVEEAGGVRTELDTVELPLIEGYADEVEAEPQFDGPRRRWMRLARMMEDAVDEDGNYEETKSCEVYVTEIGEDFVLIGLNGEQNVPIGIRIKDQLQNRSAMVLAYTGPSVGYVPGYAQLPEAGYEMSNPYSPEAEDFLVGKVMDMVSEGAEMQWVELRDEWW